MKRSIKKMNRNKKRNNSLYRLIKRRLFQDLHLIKSGGMLKEVVEL